MKFSSFNRIYLNSHLKETQVLEVDEEYLNYLKNVLRLKPGDQLRIFNENNGEFLAEVHKFNKKSIILNILKFLRPPAIEKKIILAMSLIKADKMVEAINMAVQLGVTEIIPLIAERSQIRKIKEERFIKIMIEATEQSERINVPKLFEPIILKDFIKDFKQGMIIYANENEVQKNTLNRINHYPDNIALITGPEGGFSEDELIILEGCENAFSISLGANILRAETAVVAALAQIQLMREVNAKS